MRPACAIGVRRRLVVGLRLLSRGLWWVGLGCPCRRRPNSPGRCRLRVIALPAGLAVFPGFGFVLARLLWSSGPPRDPRARRSDWASSEWARGLAVHRISLERHRHGAWRQSDAGANRLACRSARADVPCDRDLRRARDSCAPEARRPGFAPTDRRRPCIVAHRGLRSGEAIGAGERDRARRQAAADPAQHLAGRLFRPGEQGRDPSPLSRDVGSPHTPP